jgi:putative isomerase
MSVLAGDTSKFFPGFPTVAYDHPEFRSDAYWRGPAWLNVSYMALKGLQRYGYQTIADAGRQTILTWCDQNSDTLWEYYDSKTGKGLGTKQYGWTAAWLIEFILNWEDKTDP